jgi:phytoene dehydrogenase-like protein
MENIKHLLRKGASDLNFDTVVIGSGMAGLSAASLLTKQGKKVLVLEANYLPGGCSSSYFRQGYWFESGATTLVGLDDKMPLQYLLHQLGLEMSAEPLQLPMQVHLNDQIINRYHNLEQWINEAERVFGAREQRFFWEKAFAVSQLVWGNSIKQLAFPPSSLNDLLQSARNVSLSQLKSLPHAFGTIEDWLKEFGLIDNQAFVKFIDAQLMITAQNTHQEVNQLFGSAALCYTNYGNYYLKGGMIELPKLLVEYLLANGSDYRSRQKVERVTPDLNGYRVDTNSHSFTCKYVVSAIPLNNTVELWYNNKLKTKHSRYIMESPKLNSAFQMGIAFKRNQSFPCLHHQIHLSKPLPIIGATSIFLSLSHPNDHQRAPEGVVVASVSTHVPNPDMNMSFDKKVVEDAVIETLIDKGFFTVEDLLYSFSADPRAWNDWLYRKYGFVGGYPQYKNIKPWQMKDARLDGKGAYICGDSTYPGQGIPGATLSGIIAANKLLLDHP